MQRSTVWGRDDEMRRLFEIVRGRHSATLLRGDPQIGKTTLLNYFVREVRKNDDGPRVGFYKAVVTPHDPFTFVVADLLNDIYRRSHPHAQTSLIASQLRRRFSGTKLKDVSFTLWKTVSALPGVPPVDALVQWLTTEIEGFDVSLASASLSAHEVHFVIQAILEAVPEMPLLLIVDDYSAAYEGRPKGAPSAWDHGTLLHLLSENLPNVHLLIAWKDSAPTAAPLNDISQAFLQHSGTVMRLPPLTADNTLRWARAELPELLANLGESSFVTLAEGLPKVLAELQVLSIHEAPTAWAIASQVKRGSYEFLHSYLSDCPPNQTAILMQMAANELPTPASDLATILGLSVDEVVHYSKLARARDLLVELSPGLFAFEHDVKRRVVEEHLHRLYHAAPYYERSLSYHESQLEDLSPLTPASLFHTFAAFRAAHTLLTDDRYAGIESFYRSFLAWIADSRSPSMLKALLHHELRTGRPRPIQALLLRDAIALAHEELQRDDQRRTVKEAVPDGAATWFADTLGMLPTSHEVRYFIVNAAKFGSAHAAFERDDGALKAFDRSLDDLLKNDSEDITIVCEAAIALANTTVGLCPGRHRVLLELKRVGRRHQWIGDLRLTFVRAVANLVKATDSSEAWIVECLNEIEEVATGNGLSEDVAEACMRTLHDAAVFLDKWEQRERISDVVSAATEVGVRYSSFPSVAKWHSRILFNATAYFGRMSQPAKALEVFELLQQVAGAQPDPEICRDLGEACVNLIGIGLSERNQVIIERAEEAAADLHQRVPHSPEIRERYAATLAWVVIAHRESEDAVLMKRALDKLDVLTLGSNDVASARQHAAALWRVLTSLEGVRNEAYNYSDDLAHYNRMKQLLKEYARDRVVALECTIGVANVASLAGLSGDWTTIAEIIELLERTTIDFRDDEEIASHVGRGLWVAWFLSSSSAQDTLVARCEVVSAQTDSVARIFGNFQHAVEQGNRRRDD